jgi:hypothetical protein
MAVVVPYIIMAVVSVAVSFVINSLKKNKLPGSMLGDIASQTSKEGGPRTIVWGIVRPIGGNIIACSDPKIVTTTETSGGKGGGPKTTQKVENAYRTYAIGICEGPADIRRIWRNNKLVYDIRTDVVEQGLINWGEASVPSTWGIENNPVFLARATLYTGTYDQLPDPVLEGIWGVGEVPAMRGTCYMVMNDENVTDQGGALPQFVFEVTRDEEVPVA